MNLRKIKVILFTILTFMMVACNPAGTYMGDNGSVTIKKDNTWTATLHNTNHYGESYTNRLEGNLENYSTLIITKGVYQRGNDLSSVFGYLRGSKIEAYGHTYKRVEY